MKRTIKTISLLLVLAMISSLAPSAFAASTCAHEHSFHHEPTLPTCNEDGNSLEYWECLDCGKRYKNETMTRTLLTAEWEKGYLPSYGAVDEDRDGICDDCDKAVPMFEKVTSEDELTDNGKYILVAENEGSSYVLTKNLYIEGSTDDYDLTDDLLGMPAVADKITTYDNYIYFEDANDNEALLLTLRENTYDGWYNFAYPFENEFRYLNGDYTQTSNLVTTQYITASPLKPVINKDGSVKLLWMYEETSYPANFKAVHETYTNGVLDDIDADLISFVFKDYYTNTNKFIENRTRILKNYLYATNEYYRNVITNDHTDRIGSAYSYDYDEVPVYLYKLIEGGVRNNVRYALRNSRTEVNYEIITNLDTDLETAMAENSVKGVSNALSQDAIDYYVDLLAGDRDDIILNVSADLTVSDYERDKKVTFAVNPYIFNIAYPDNKVTIDDAFFTGAIMPVTLYTCGVKPVQVIHEKQDGTKEYFYPEDSAAARRGKNTFTLNETENGEYYVTIGLTEFSDITIYSEEQEEEIAETTEPTVEPTEEPTEEPTAKPTVEPTIEPTVEPTNKPVYEISWYDENGNLIDTTFVEHGEMPSHEPLTKENTAEYTYTFSKWMPLIQPATGNASYRPLFINTTNKYSVTKVASANGTFTITPEDEKIPYGTEIIIETVADKDYEVDAIYAETNGEKTEINKTDNGYVYIVTGDTEIEVTFKEIPPVTHAEIVEQGSCGESVTYTLDDQGTLTISGTGAMTGYRSAISPFRDNTNIKNVIIENGITSIGERAFYGCSGITSVTIGKDVIESGDAAFEDCTELKDVYITDVGQWCMINFEVLHHDIAEAKIYYYSSNPMYYAENLYVNGELLTELNIPEDVAGVRSRAFYGYDKLTKVNVSDSVTSIGDYAFSDCTGIENVNLGNGIQGIGRRAFYNCSGITSITVPESVTYMANESFTGCKIKTVNYNAIHCDVPQISGFIYSPFTSVPVETFIIGDKVASIPTYLLYNCGSLKSVTIGKSLKNIGYNAFYRCSDLESVYISDLEAYLNIESSVDPMYYAKKLYLNNKRVSGNIVIPDTITTIPGYAFHNCDGITSVTIPDSVTSIDSYAFEGCSVLKDVYITDLEKWCRIVFGSTSANPMYYGANLHVNGSLLTELVIPASIMGIESAAFIGCDSLTSVTIPDSVTKIDVNAFSKCSGLTSITIGTGVTSIGSSVFYGCKNVTTVNYNSQKVPDAFNRCKNLAHVILGENVTNIDTDAFSGCTNLTDILIPKSVTEIEGSAFKDCSSLTTVYYCGSETEWNEIFIGANNDYLKNANIHYNTTDIPDIITPTPPPTPTPYVPLECNVDYEVVDNNITFTVEVKDITRADELNNVQLYAAEFDENGRFIGLTTGAKSEVQDGKITITAAVPNTEDYKFFLWDSFLAPLMSVLDSDNITK